jgi:hypothetical protein
LNIEKQPWEIQAEKTLRQLQDVSATLDRINNNIREFNREASKVVTAIRASRQLPVGTN